MKLINWFFSVFLILMLTNSNLNGQIVNQGMDDDIQLAVNKGDLMVTGFMSYPNWGRYFANLEINSGNYQNGSTGGFAPLGGQLEYMLSDNFGFSLDAIFNQWSASWNSSGFDNNGDPIVYDNEVKVSRTRLLLGLNYHLDDLKNDQLNLYGGFAVGFNSRRVNVQVDDAGIGSFWEGQFAFPLAVRARLGMRYFVTETVGLNFELGAGGPILRFGLTFKFPT